MAKPGGSAVSSAAPDEIDLFLSHNSADKPWVVELAAQVESETFDGTPRGRPLRTFLDVWDIDIGQNVIQRLNDGLSRARYVAVVLSPEFLAAGWPTFEWTHIVADDPTNRKGRLVPLFVRSKSLDGNNVIDLPAPFKALNWLDFRSKKDFRKSYQRLIRKIRDLPPPRGPKRRPLAGMPSPPQPAVPSAPESPASPDRISEAILGNLLPVEHWPTTVWSAPTEARKRQDVYEKLPSSAGFVLQEKRLYTFADLTRKDEPLRQVVDCAGIKPDGVVRWRGDEVRWRWFISLLNKNLRNHTGRMPIRVDRKGRYFFRPTKEGETRVWQNQKDPKREVAALKINQTTGEAFWVHQSSWLRFLTLGDSLFLCIEPSYVFTSDGATPLEGPSVGPLTMLWGGKERNAAILRHLIFWSRTLSRSKPKIEIETGGAPIVISGIPALARTIFGVEFDHIGIGSLMAQVDDELKLVADAVTIDASATVVEAEEDDHEEEDDPESSDGKAA